jgi:hypothetical protein
MEKKKILIELTILILLTVIFGLGSFGSAFSSTINYIDEGQFAAWVEQMLKGKLMYKDIYITY